MRTQRLQSKLNCEVLYDDLAFEVRWAVAGESVVIQLVAKLGELVFCLLLVLGSCSYAILGTVKPICALYNCIQCAQP
jgi:hypothetical protein